MKVAAFERKREPYGRPRWKHERTQLSPLTVAGEAYVYPMHTGVMYNYMCVQK